MKKLQVKVGENWRFVFCHNPATGIVTTENRRNAIGAEAIYYFKQKFANHNFRAEPANKTNGRKA